MSLLPNLDEMTDNEKMAVLESIQKSIAQSKEIQKQKIAANVDLVVQALKKIETDIRSRFDDVGNAIEKRVSTIKDGRDGINGKDGRDGKDGKNGRDGAKGDRGERGQDGRDGSNGVDGVSVSNARIDFDGSLIITLSTGVELNVGEVVAPDLAESIKVITNGGGTSQYVLDTLASLQTQITNLIPSQTGNSGKYLTTNGSALSWGSISGGLYYQGTWNASTNTPTLTSSVGVNGYYYITATAGSTNLDGITDWQIGDWLMFNGSVWQKIDQSNLVTSVNGQTGAVSVGTVTSVTGTSPVASSGGATPAISLSAGYGDTLNPYASKTANFVLAAPNGSAGVPTFRAVVAADIPTLNQSTTGSAATLTTTRAIYGNNFDGSAALTQVIASTFGGTGNGFTKFTGATTAEKTYTLPDASSTIVVQGGALGTPSSGTVTNLTGTASININGTVGATTPAAGTFTSLSDSGNLTFTGTGNRITGDFTNATLASRVMFQTSTTNGQSALGLLPNGTSTQTQYIAFNGTDPANSSYVQTLISATEARINSGQLGTGTNLPMTFYTGGSESLRLSETSKAVILSGGSTSANGTGITFPATQSASTNANTLDDYEEGTWTPNQGAGLTVVGTFGSSGSYTKVGRLVTVIGLVTGSTSIASSGGGAICSNLPFTSASGTVGGVADANGGGGSCLTSTTSVLSYPAHTASAGIYFTVTYAV